MSVTVKHNRIIHTIGTENKHHLKGSAKYLIDGDEIKLKPKKLSTDSKRHDTEPIRKTYRLNKDKVRSKIMAFKSMYPTSNFAKFITISFPRFFEDEHCKMALNTWLTRLRKLDPRFEYIWIAERQQNKTLHFHIITYQYFNIRVINRYMAKTIRNLQLKYDMFWINFDIDKYNGVDIRVIYDTETISKYVTKYVSKNDSEEKFLLWNCSSRVSALFTEISITEGELKAVLNHMKLWRKEPITIKTQYMDIQIFTLINRKGTAPPYYHRVEDYNRQIWQQISN